MRVDGYEIRPCRVDIKCLQETQMPKKKVVKRPNLGRSTQVSWLDSENQALEKLVRKNGGHALTSKLIEEWKDIDDNMR